MGNQDIVTCSFVDFLKAGFPLYLHGFYHEEFVVFIEKGSKNFFVDFDWLIKM